MTAELISVGSKLLTGNIVNSNARFLAEQCALLGLDMYCQVTVGDDYGRLKAVIETALGRSDLILLTGGPGPAEDNLTREVCAKVMGTEPGLIMERDGKAAILLPGSSQELYPMFRDQVVPWLQQRQRSVAVSRIVKLCGCGVNQAQDMIRDLIDSRTNPAIAAYAKTAGVLLRITARAQARGEAERLIEPVLDEIKRRFGKKIYTTDEHVSLEMAVAELLKKQGLTMSTAESCTGGMVAAKMVNVPGVSQVFTQGMVTYSNEAKMRLLGVREETLQAYGAVSAQTAEEMAAGGAAMSGTDVCVAITGLAGPDGGTDQKPVGLVYMACSHKGRVRAEEFRFKGNRDKIREQSVIRALDLVRLCILED